MKRRDFLKATTIATGAAIVPGCNPPKGTHKLVSPLFPPPDGIIPGEPYFLKTTCTECPAGCGVTVRMIDGIPIKLEGTQGHPVNDGALCIRGQASLTRLYNPRRLKHPMRKEQSGWKKITWDEAYETIETAMRRSGMVDKKNVYLSGLTTGSLSGLIDTFCNTAGIERAREFEVFNYANLRRANQMVFGRDAVPNYRIADSDVLITIGADIFQTFVSPVSHQKQLTQAKERGGFRWLHIEPHVSLEGLQADVRLPVRPQSEAVLLAWLLNNLARAKGRGVPAGVPNPTESQTAEATGLDVSRLQELAQALQQASRPLVISGGVSHNSQTGLETALLTAYLQSVGNMLPLIDFSRAQNYATVGTAADIEQLGNELEANRVGVVFISRADPVGGSSGELHFAEKLQRAEMRVGISDSMNDSMEACDILLPLSHSLESPGDAVPQTGLRTLIQPLLTEKLHDTQTEGDILLGLAQKLTGNSLAEDYHAYLKQRWSDAYGPDYEEGFQNTGYRRAEMQPAALEASGAAAAGAFTEPLSRGISDDISLILVPSIRYFDGRSRDLKLLNEIPDPLTTITYGQWVSISPNTASDMGLSDGDEVELSVNGWKQAYPIKIQPRLADNVVMLDRSFVSSPSMPVDRRTGQALGVISGVSINATGQAKKLAIIAGSPSQHGRGIVPEPIHLDSKPDKDKHEYHPLTLYPDLPDKEYRWAMAIDLDKCTGCGACVAACYVENNIPLVGEQEHLKGREMSWIRIEPFYDGDEGAAIQPMMCQQCTNAPCEAVCPVFATYHNKEGINAQIYNRCVGTRYCANNCPYKVRRFNWFDTRPAKGDNTQPDADFTNSRELPLDKVSNPLVSLRGRGVMEKCTFCIQRIRAGHDHAKDENRKVQDGEIVPACAQTCPSEAIVFGNKLDEESRVSRFVEHEHIHRVFEDLGTEPAVFYLNDRRRLGSEG